MAHVKQLEDFPPENAERPTFRFLVVDPKVDELYLSFSEGREHGPLIERVGNDAPRMRCLDEGAIGESWTTDPELQRLGAWFIRIEDKLATCVQAYLYVAFYGSRFEDEDDLARHFPTWGHTFDLLEQTPIPKLWKSFSDARVATTRDNKYLRFTGNRRVITSAFDELCKSCSSASSTFDGDFFKKLSKRLEPDLSWPEHNPVFTTMRVPRNPRSLKIDTKVNRSERERLKDSSGTVGFKKWLTLLMWSLDTPVHKEAVEQRIPQDSTIIAYQGCGDLSMNYWNVGFHQKIDRSSSNHKVVGEHFIYPFDEPVENRKYTCFVKWRQSELEGLRSLALAPAIEHQYEVRELRFNRQATSTRERVTIDVHVPSEVRRVSPQPVGDKVEFAVYGQRVVRDSRVEEMHATIHQFSDLRHIFLLPNLNQRPGNVLFAREQNNDVWLGEYALLRDRNRRMAALSGPVQFELSELGATAELVEEALEGSHSGNCYCEIADPLTPLQAGQYRRVEEGRELWYEIFFRRNEYPCTMIGITHEGTVVMMAWKGCYSRRFGWTVQAAAKKMVDQGVAQAVVIDEGSDVFQYYEPAGTQLPPGRPQVRALFFVAAPGV